VHGLLALPAVLLALTPFHSSAKPLPAPVKAQLKFGGFWHQGCPVGLSDLRVLTVAHRGWDGRTHTGQLIVNARAVGPLSRSFRSLYRLHFPIRHMRIADFYGPRRGRPKDGDVTASFECRQAVPSPCTGASEAVTRPLAEAGGTGSWSMHAYGLAVDVNPGENPYVGCGQSRDPALRRYRDRSRHLKGMVTPRAVAGFRVAGWGWGGAWSGNTQDYMHFSSTGH
jgi:hypothetical protein